MRRVIVVGETLDADPALLKIMEDVQPDSLYVCLDMLADVLFLEGDVVVTLGKSAIEVVLNEKVKLDDVVGQQYDIPVNEVLVKVISQYHPSYINKMAEKKGGASEKVAKAYFDIWDVVQVASTGEEAEIPEVDIVTEFDDVIFRLDQLMEADFVVAYDYETYGENSRGENLALRPELCRYFVILTIGVAVACDGEWSAFSFPYQWEDQQTHKDHWTPEQLEEISWRWQAILAKEKSVAHYAKYEGKCNMKVFGKTWISRDTMLMDDTLNEVNDHKLHRVGARCGLRWMRYKSESDGIRKAPRDAELPKLLRYNALDALTTILSHDHLEAELIALDPVNESQIGCARMEEDFSLRLSIMEMTGMQINPSAAAAVRAELKEEIPKLEARFQELPEVKRVCKWALRNIKKYATKAYQNGTKLVVFNPKSPPMMKRLILDELKIDVPFIKKNGKETQSFDKRALEPYEESNPVLGELVGVRRISAMLTGFLDKWEAFVDDLARVHSQYNQARVVTGRLSSSDPPQQNIPKKHKVRRVYVSRYKDGWLVNADVKQQEPRLLAGWSGDEKMIEAINSGYDLHGFVASEIYEVEYLGDKTEGREVGKRMNLGMMYGQTEHGLAAKTGMSVASALSLLHRYDQRFPKIAVQRVLWQQFAATHGYAEDLFGRRRHLPDALSPKKWIRERALRQASNYPIQRTALVFTMISLGVAMQEIEKEGWQEEMCIVSTVHDSIIGDSADLHYRKKLIDIMQYGVECHNVAPWWKDKGVPMAADIEVGKNLYELEKVR